MGKAGLALAASLLAGPVWAQTAPPLRVDIEIVLNRPPVAPEISRTSSGLGASHRQDIEVTLNRSPIAPATERTTSGLAAPLRQDIEINSPPRRPS